MIRVAGLLSAVLLTASAMAEPELPQGWMVWHHYSEYSALDSRLYLRQPDGEIKEITGDFIHPMNGSFGVTPDSLVFMAIDRAADEWDIYRYSSDSGMCVNLTERSGFRNEDPKFSPDGKTIVFKRGFWNPAADDFQYDLALMDVETREVRMLTDDMTEEAMPCFSADGETAVPLDLLNTERNELGADFYSAAEYEAYRKKQSLGDVNGDTVRSMADVVLLVKWLVQMPDAAIPNASAADLNADGILNVLDLTALKRLIFAADSN